MAEKDVTGTRSQHYGVTRKLWFHAFRRDQFQNGIPGYHRSDGQSYIMLEQYGAFLKAIWYAQEIGLDLVPMNGLSGVH